MKSKMSLGIVALIASMVLPGCDDDNSGGGGGPTCGDLPQPLTAVSPDPVGSWCFTEVVSSSDPQCDGETRSFDVAVAVAGNTVTADVRGGGSFAGTGSGNTVEWSGSFPDNGGTSSVSCAEFTITSVDSISGSSSFVFTEPGFSCSGTTALTGVRGNCP